MRPPFLIKKNRFFSSLQRFLKLSINKPELQFLFLPRRYFATKTVFQVSVKGKNKMHSSFAGAKTGQTNGIVHCPLFKNLRQQKTPVYGAAISMGKWQQDQSASAISCGLAGGKARQWPPLQCAFDLFP